MRRIIGPLLALLTLTGAYLYGFPAPTLVLRRRRHRPRRRRPRRGGVARAAGACGRHAVVARAGGVGRRLARRGGRPGDRQDRRDAALSPARPGAHRRERGRHRDPLGGAPRPHGASHQPGRSTARTCRQPRTATTWAGLQRGTTAGGIGRRRRRHRCRGVRRVVRARSAVAPVLPDSEPHAAARGDDAGRAWARRARSSRARSGRPTASRSSAASSWTRRRASAATATSTSSGTARRTTSRRSTTSGTASPSSTCRTSIGTEAVEVVRRLPRSGAAVQRPDGHARSKRSLHTPEAQAGLGCVACHAIVDGRQHDGPGRLHDGVPDAVGPRRERAAGDAVPPRLPREGESRAAPPRVPEAVHEGPGGGLLLHVPQGPPRRAGEQLPLDPRLQRLRQLAGERRLGHGRAVVLLPAEVAALRRLPHAEGRVERLRQQARARLARTASRRRTRRCRRRTRTSRQLDAVTQLPEGQAGHRWTSSPSARRSRASEAGAMVPGSELVDDLRGRRRRRDGERRAAAARHATWRRSPRR